MAGSLLPQYDGMIRSIAKRYIFESPRFTIEDLMDEGRCAAIKAIKERPQNTLYKESTWVWNAIRTAIMTFIRQNKYDVHVSEQQQKESWREKEKADDLNRHAMAIRIDAIPQNFDDSDQYDIIASGEPPPLEKLISEENISILYEELNALPEREKNIIQAIYINGSKLREVAEVEGITTQRVDQIRNRAFTKLQKLVKKRYANELV